MVVHLEQGNDEVAQGINAGIARGQLDEHAPAVQHDPSGHNGLSQLHRWVLGQLPRN